MIQYVVRMSGPFVASLLIANTAWAGPCPENFSFVELGHIDANGSVNPGGPTFRVAQDGQTLLTKTPSCHRFSGEAAPLVDDNGDPIPLVGTLGYDPSNITANVSGFGVTRVKVEATSLAALNELMRAAVREDPTIERTVGDGFACYSRAFATFPSLTCEVDNPFDSTQQIHLSCDNGDCSIIGIVMSSDLIASTNWNGNYASPMAVGLDAVKVVSDIHLFLINQMVE